MWLVYLVIILIAVFFFRRSIRMMAETAEDALFQANKETKALLADVETNRQVRLRRLAVKQAELTADGQKWLEPEDLLYHRRNTESE